MNKTKSLVTAVAAVLLVGGGYLAVAQPGDPGQHHPATTKKAQKAQKAPSMEMCKQMMADREMQMTHMKEMDAKLETMVADMDAATGEAKANATSALVKEMVAQRKMMRPMMESMDAKMMEHMMQHMKSGKMDCPMMKGMMGD